ncbi:MAG: hypothetical protein M1812_006356 [Candelaria pacifica]|nr:MAG: hypothetical protein M1812_006356 [Candelaria pacifica]
MDDLNYDEGSRKRLHVLDLPQLYTKPSPKDLLDALALVAVPPVSWDSDNNASIEVDRQVEEVGIPQYLTTIVSSTLQWIEDDEMKEKIWELASARLSQRSGRTAMPAMSRTFGIPTTLSSVDIVLHEPSLTADNLGLKTWGSSYLLARRLHLLSFPGPLYGQRLRVLELGSGTGLVGIAAAAIGGATVHLTDLSEILPNLTRNVQENWGLITRNGGFATTAVLDWSDDGESPGPEDVADRVSDHGGRFPVILAADPLYSPQHPQLFVQAIRRWLSRSKDARVVVELPLRDTYAPEIEEFRKTMRVSGLKVIEQGEEVGFDDWGGGVEGGLREVRYWWGVWAWGNQKGTEP